MPLALDAVFSPRRCRSDSRPASSTEQPCSPRTTKAAVQRARSPVATGRRRDDRGHIRRARDRYDDHESADTSAGSCIVRQIRHVRPRLHRMEAGAITACATTRAYPWNGRRECRTLPILMLGRKLTSRLENVHAAHAGDGIRGESRRGSAKDAWHVKENGEPTPGWHSAVTARPRFPRAIPSR
jgi:hypothetical protein